MRLILAASLLILAGCSGDLGRPATALVEGTVTYRGKPVEGAVVSYLCSGAPRVAYGTTDAAGHYRLTTFVENDGAVIGTHVVAIKKHAGQAVGESPQPAKPLDGASMAKAIDAEMQQSARHAVKAERIGSLLPAKYADQRTSDLQKEVVPGDNVINIELVD